METLQLLLAVLGDLLRIGLQIIALDWTLYSAALFVSFILPNPRLFYFLVGRFYRAREWMQR
mgnify:CR=1 FL=1